MFQQQFPKLFRIINDDTDDVELIIDFFHQYEIPEVALVEQTRSWLPNGSLFFHHMHDSEILGIDRTENAVQLRISDIHSCDFFGSLFCELFGKGKDIPRYAPLEVVFEFTDSSKCAFYKITDNGLKECDIAGYYSYYSQEILELRPGLCHIAFLMDNSETREVDLILEVKSRGFRIIDKIRESFARLFGDEYDYYLNRYLNEREHILTLEGRDRLNYIRELIKSKPSD